jgi:aspartate kinase
MLKKHAAHGAVIPGFYGGDLDGREVRVFSRGGSDVTGSIVARSVGAEVYENWTDVSGMYAADPTIVTNPRRIAEMTSAEARELAYMGASVIHPEALFPVGQAGITTRILNTNRPQDPGTDIVPNGCLQRRPGSITGIAGRRGFVVISIDKALMNQEVGFARRALEVLERHGINLDHMPGGIDTVSIVIDGATLDDNALAAVAAEIKTVCAADEVRVERGLAMIATVGQGMVHTPGVAARLTGALAAKRINIRMINQGASELSVIIGVADQDYEAAIRAIYEAHFN